MKDKTILATPKRKSVYREGDTVVKLFDESFSTADILNEALNQSRVAETDLCVPSIHEVKKIDGKWAIVMDYLPGTPLNVLMAKHPEKKMDYLLKFVDIQLEMHEKNVPLLNKLKDKMERKVASTELDENTKFELQTRLNGMPNHTKLCHGDYNPSNVILDKNGNAGLIDWSHATQGNASADAARTYLRFCLDGDKDTADQYLELFCLKSNTEKKYVQSWLPIVAASQSVKGNPEEREMLLKWASVMEYQ